MYKVTYRTNRVYDEVDAEDCQVIDGWVKFRDERGVTVFLINNADVHSIQRIERAREKAAQA